MVTRGKGSARGQSPSAPLARSILGLKRIKLFTGLPDNILADLAEQCVWRHCHSGQRVISRDSRDRDVYLVVSGRVRVTSFSASGRQVTYRDILAGDWFGDFAAIDGLSRSADIITLEDTLVASMTPELFQQILHAYPTACDQVLLRLVTSVRHLTERIFDLSTLGVQNRLHAELLRLAREAGVRNNMARIDPAPKHAELSSQISTYREQVTRELSAMAKQGLVRRAGRALVLQDVALLEKIVADVRRTTL